MRPVLAAVALFGMALGDPVTAQTLTPEIPNWNHPDIATVFPDPWSPTGAVIVYNPGTCQQIGLACLFAKFHEHGHVALGHHFQPGVYRMEQERDADRYAATYAPPQAVLAAWHLFMSGGSSSDGTIYGTPQERARRLCLFAQQAGNWIGPVSCS